MPKKKFSHPSCIWSCQETPAPGEASLNIIHLAMSIQLLSANIESIYCVSYSNANGCFHLMHVIIKIASMNIRNEIISKAICANQMICI